MNDLSPQQQLRIAFLLVEGLPIRSAARLEGVDCRSIRRLLLNLGGACHQLLDRFMRSLPVDHWHVDQIPLRRLNGKDLTNQCLYVSLGTSSRLAPNFVVGSRSSRTARKLSIDLMDRSSATPARTIYLGDGERLPGTRRFVQRFLRIPFQLLHLEAAVALYLAHYNWCRIDRTLGATPMAAAGLTQERWSLEQMIHSAFDWAA